MNAWKLRVAGSIMALALLCVAMPPPLSAQSTTDTIPSPVYGSALSSEPTTTTQSAAGAGVANTADLAADNPAQPGAAERSGDNAAPREESKRIFGIIPNYRTSPSLQNYEPLTTREKFKVAAEDSFDRGTVALAVVFAAYGQLTNGNRAFGQGAAGFSQYFGASYADWVIGNYMTEGVFPTLLHQDPRYFRRGTGSGLSRLTYAMGQIFLTHNDSGRTQFNYSEVLGNSTAVAVSMAYYKDNRDVSDAVTQLGWQLGIDMACNVLKEFYPDVERKLWRKHKQDTTASAWR
jgi:hypothetical protein